jgi:hypothetical protein
MDSNSLPDTNPIPRLESPETQPRLPTQDDSSPDPSPIPVVSQPEPEKVLYSWTAPSRLFKKRNREFYTTVGALVILISVILLFAKEFLLVGVILSFGFVTYVLSTIPPEAINHRLTNKGIRTIDKFYSWFTLGRYWYETKWHQDQLLIESPTQFPGRLTLLLGQGDKKTLDSIVSKYLVRQKPDPTWFDKASKWLQEKVPLESDEELKTSTRQ